MQIMYVSVSVCMGKSERFVICIYITCTMIYIRSKRKRDNEAEIHEKEREIKELRQQITTLSEKLKNAEESIKQNCFLKEKDRKIIVSMFTSDALQKLGT